MRKTQYAWMALGGLICLFGLVLACKLRDGNKANAQPEKMDPPPLLSMGEEKKPTAPAPSMLTKPMPPPAPTTASLPPFLKTEPDQEPPTISKKSKETVRKDKPSEPKATLSMPLPAEPSTMPLPPAAASPPLPVSPSGLLPASFGPNTPTPTDKKTADPLPPSAKPDDKKVADPLLSSAKPEDAKSSPKTEKMPLRISDIQAPKPDVPAPKPGSTEGKKKPTDASPLKSPSFVDKPKAGEKKNEKASPPRWNAPVDTAAPSGPASGSGHGYYPVDDPKAPGAVPPSTAPSDHDTVRTQPGEPPLAPAPGPVQLYHVHHRETLQDIARRTLGNSERWGDLHKLNPSLKPDEPLDAGTTVRLPADACVQSDDAEAIKPLPALRPKPTAPKAKVLPLTGTYQCSLDSKGQLTLPRALRDQLNSSDTILLSPGPDKCLWLTNQPHLERLGERLEQSRANEADVRVFKRLYFAQTEKLTVNGEGRVNIPERLSEFAGLQQEVVLVGIDDHFEVWDAARWRSYTQQKSGARAAVAEQE